MRRGGDFEKLSPEILNKLYRLCSTHFDDNQFMNINLKKSRI